jgi:hypothetical protein
MANPDSYVAIGVKKSTYDRLNQLRGAGRGFDSVVVGLLDAHEKRKGGNVRAGR